MEEMNTNQEPVIEQRPSQKYGRTAYQQELKAQEEVPEQQWQPYTEATVQTGEVTNLFANILMVLVAISGIISATISIMVAQGYQYVESMNFDAMYEAIEKVAMTPTVQMISLVGDLVGYIAIAMVVVDILMLLKARYKITGAILFAIFFRPAYFIWRAHLLKQDKKGPIIFLVGYCLLFVVEMGFIMSQAMEMMYRFM